MGIADQRIISGRYQVFPRTLCFVIHGDHILMLRGASDKPIWPNLYNGVGGHVEPDEDVRSAALREIREETGLEVSDLQLRGVINIPTAVHNTGVLLFVFTATTDTWEVHPSEEGTLEWVPLDEVTRLKLVEDLPMLLPRVLGEKGAVPFFAHYHYDEHDRLQVTFAGQEDAPSGKV